MKLYIMKWDYRFIKGQNRKKTVREVYNFGPRWRDWLVFCYYYLNYLSFDDEILEALDISEKIDKPGSNESAFHRWREAHPMSEDELTAVRYKKMGEVMHKRAVKRRIEEQAIKATDTFVKIRDNYESCKGRLQARNHGRKQ